MSRPISTSRPARLYGVLFAIAAQFSLGCQMPRPADAYLPNDGVGTEDVHDPVSVDRPADGAVGPAPRDASVPPPPPPPPADTGDGGGGAQSAAQRLQGDYLLRVRSTATDRDVALGNVTTTATTYGIVALRVRGGQLVADEQLCFMEFDVRASSSSVTTTVPETVPQTTPRVQRVYTLDGAGGFRSERAPFAMGFHDDGGPLPTSRTDSRVYDQDGDGYLGVPMRTRVSGARGVDCTFHIVRRIDDTYAGSLAGDALGEGTVTDHGGAQYALSVTDNGGGGLASCDVSDANSRDPVTPTTNVVRFAKVDPIDGFVCPARGVFSARLP